MLSERTVVSGWDVGPFDNDGAADFCIELDDLMEQDRPTAIREALETAVREEGYLDVDDGSRAVAAAALVAAQCPGGRPVGVGYGPERPIPVLPDDLRALAVQALDRVTDEDSEVQGLWGEDEDASEEWREKYGGKWEEEVRQLREILAAASG